MSVLIVTEEEYLSVNGASRQDIGECALHKNRRGYSDKAWHKVIKNQAEKDHVLIIKRARLREEYQQKLLSGEVKAPSQLDSLKSKASGLPERLDVQAARRILEKRGIDWKVFTPIENHVCPFTLTV